MGARGRMPGIAAEIKNATRSAAPRMRARSSMRVEASSRKRGESSSSTRPTWRKNTVSARNARPGWSRSEEHTSELQSHVNLVCRLLLEKKKKKTYNKILQPQVEENESSH